MDEVILEKIAELKQLINEQNMQRKEVLALDEAALYLGISKSHLYKMTSTGTISCYKPSGKRIYFKRAELDEWLVSKKQFSLDDIQSKADDYLIKKGRAV